MAPAINLLCCFSDVASAAAALQAAKRVEVHKFDEHLRVLASVWQFLRSYHIEV